MKNITPFEQAIIDVQENKIKAPTVHYGNQPIDYFKYQLAVHKYNLSLMSVGIMSRGVKLKDLKWYYGLKGKSAKDCYADFLIKFSHIL